MLLPQAGKGSMSPPAECRNALLGHLSDEDRSLISPHLSPIDLPLRFRLAEPNAPIEHAYFLDSGIASTVSHVRHEVPIEIGIIGREGVVNLPVVMGVDRAPNATFMQVGGTGQRIAADPLRTAMDQSPDISRTLHRFAHVFMVQNASTILANGCGTVSERLARWLTMAHDRADGDRVELTQEFLAIMLGVRRPSVTTLLRDFEQRGLAVREVDL